jgi:hypothetical protein
MKVDIEDTNKNAALVIIALIALAGLGLGGYSFYQLQKEGNLQVILLPIPAESSNLAIGLWNNLSRSTYGEYNTSNWLIQVNSSQIFHSSFFSLSNHSTRFNIEKKGWYKIHLSLALVNLTENEEYSVNFNKNNITEFQFAKFNSSGASYYLVNSYQFVYLNSSDYFELNCRSNSTFNIGKTDLYQNYNQLSLEYIFSFFYE